MVNQILVDYLQLKVTSPVHKDNFYKSYKTVENSQNCNLRQQAGKMTLKSTMQLVGSLELLKVISKNKRS